MPITFLRQLIRFYGDSIQSLVPSFLEFSIENLVRDQQKLREQMTQQIAAGWKQGPWGGGAFGALEEQARNNMAMFERAFRMFSPFKKTSDEAGLVSAQDDLAARSEADLDSLRKELAEMKDRLDRITEPKR